MTQKQLNSFEIQYTNGKRINLNKLKNQIDRNLLKINLITDQLFTHTHSHTNINKTSIPLNNAYHRSITPHPSNYLFASQENNLQEQKVIENIKCRLQNRMKTITPHPTAKQNINIHPKPYDFFNINNQEQKLVDSLNTTSNKHPQKQKIDQMFITIKCPDYKQNQPQVVKKVRRRPKTDRTASSSKGLQEPKYIPSHLYLTNIQHQIENLQKLPRRQIDTHLKQLILKQVQKTKQSSEPK